jgi:hypothetical protein
VHLEKRTRVEIFLPIRFDSLKYEIVTEWLAEELAYTRGGSTLTTPFTGFYLITVPSARCTLTEPESRTPYRHTCHRHSHQR